MKGKEKNYITAFVFDSAEKYLCISLSRFIFWAPSFKFGICQVRFKRHSDRLSSSFSHLASALSGRISVRATQTHTARAVHRNRKPQHDYNIGNAFITFDMHPHIQMLQRILLHSLLCLCVCLFAATLGCGGLLNNWYFKQNNSSAQLTQNVISNILQ